MNTRISYLYRDAHNYKMWNECVVAGVITEEMKAVIMCSLDSGEFFIPSQVGLPEKRFSKLTDADHCWFELDEDGFEETEDAPTVAVTAEALTEAFRSCAGKWDDTLFGWITDEYVEEVQEEEEEEDEMATSIYTDLTPDEFRELLRKMQEDGPYQWPNLYFAWEKPDGSLFIVGTNSTQQHQMLVKEVNRDDWLNTSRAACGQPLEYSSRLYGISPNCSYMENNQRYDPVERLASKVAEYTYLGAWQDPDILMDGPYGYNRVIACGRWELAVSHICPEKLTALYPGKGLVVDELIRDAKTREIVDNSKRVEDKTLE